MYRCDQTYGRGCSAVDNPDPATLGTSRAQRRGTGRQRLEQPPRRLHSAGTEVQKSTKVHAAERFACESVN